MENWKMTLRFEGKDFAYLKSITTEILKRVNKARTYKELPIMGAGGGGQNGNDFSYSVEYSCPTEQRISNLRSEADTLEAESSIASTV